MQQKSPVQDQNLNEVIQTLQDLIAQADAKIKQSAKTQKFEQTKARLYQEV